MKSAIVGFFLWALCLGANAQPVEIQTNPNVDPVQDITDKLALQLTLIEEIRPHVQLPEKPDFLVLRATTERALQNLKSKTYNPIHKEVIRALEDMYIAYAFNEAFFTSIASDIAADPLAKVQKIAEWVAERRGYGEEYRRKIFFSTNTLSSLKQIYRLVLQLDSQPLRPELKKKLEELKPMLGTAMARSQTDWKPAFDAAAVVCKYIRGLYPEFQQIGVHDAAADIVGQIQGLNELYIRASGIFK